VSAQFIKQAHGAIVATILETDDSIVEVQERNDGVYGLIVHHRREDRDRWDDLTAYLKPEHFDLLGSVAERMRGESEKRQAVSAEPLQPTDEMLDAGMEYSMVLDRDAVRGMWRAMVEARQGRVKS
jgi:hypothetical protein